MTREAIPTELLYELIDNMPTMAYYCDIEGDPKFLNAAYTRFTGYTVEDVGNFRWKGLKLVHPDDVIVVVNAWKSSIGKMEPYTSEYRLMNADGNYHWVRSRAFYVKDKDGIPYAWFGTIEDINEDKMRLQSVIEGLESKLDEFKRMKHDFRNQVQDTLDRQISQ